MLSNLLSAKLLIISFVFVLLITGCSGSRSPITPLTESRQVHLTPVETNRGLWGVWDIAISPNDGIIEAVPDRTTSFSCNIINFLQPPKVPVHMLTTELDLAASDIPNGYIEIDITLNHPFPGTVLCGHDVFGVVMDNFDSSTLASDPEITLSMPPDTLLLNPDGYTRWWNQTEFTSYGTLFGYTQGNKAKGDFFCDKTLNPFIYFSDDIGELGLYNPNPLQRGFFSSLDPGINTRRFLLQFKTDGGSPVWQFKYAVSASYVKPNDSAEPPYTASDFPISANQPEAYWLGYIDNESTAYFENGSTYGGDLDFFIEVRDWQFAGNISTVNEELSSLVIESPTLFDSPVNLDISLAEPVAGNPTAFRIPGHIEDVTPSASSNQYLIITAVCANPTGYDPQIPGIEGFVYPASPLAAYGVVNVPILYESTNIPPVADASESTPLSGLAPLSVTLDPSASFDTDGTIVLYEWDYENDGTFDSSTAVPDGLIHIFDEGEHEVNLRVTDNDGATDTLDEPLNITADPPGMPCEGEDESEPNNSCETADPLTLNTPMYGCVQEEWDMNDHWEFVLPADGTVNIHVYNDGPGDIDLGYNAWDCEWLGGSGLHGAGQDEYVNDVHLMAGTYFIHVTADNDSGAYEPERPYHAKITFMPDQVDNTIGYGRIHGNHCLQINSQGNPEVFFSRAPGDVLGYAIWNGVDWDHLNGTQGTYHAEGLAIGPGDIRHIIYGSTGYASFDYATYNGSAWNDTIIYGTTWPGTDSSIALDSDYLPHIGMHGGGGAGQGVRHYWFDSIDWNMEQPITGDQLISPHIEMDSDDYAHIMTHYMYGSSYLWHIYEDGDGWHTDNLEISGNMPHSEFDSQGILHCAYSTGAGGDADNNIGYFYWDGESWSTPVTVDDSADLRYPSLVLDSNDNPHISYLDRTSDFLKYAYFDGADWTIQTIIDDVEVLGRNSITILPDDTPVIAYNDNTNGTVECVWVE